MRTNIEIDAALIAEAMAELGVNTKREAVHKALESVTRKARQLRALEELRGSGWVGDLEEMRTSKYLPAK